MNPALRVLIACEYTGTVRRAFDALGHDVWSCDIKRAEDGSNRHIRGDVREILHDGWDLLIVAHPPCTRLCNSGVRWLSGAPGKLSPENHTEQEIFDYCWMNETERLAFMWKSLDEGAALFSDLWNAPIERVAVENPVMHRHAKERIKNYAPPAQGVQPWQFGDWETKETWLWLRGLPALKAPYPSLADARLALGKADDEKPEARVWRMPPGPERSAERSRFFPSIAAAMAEQWGGYALERVAA